MAVVLLSFSRLPLVPASSYAVSASLPPTGGPLLSSSHSFAITPISLAGGRGLSLTEVARRPSFVAAAVPAKKQKADSAVKRARQAEQRRIYNRARKSEIHTRMKKVFVAIDGLKKNFNATTEMLSPVEVLIGEAFSTIDKAVKVGTLHRNTGARRKSRLSRAKKALEMQLGWYTPSTAPGA